MHGFGESETEQRLAAANLAVERAVVQNRNGGRVRHPVGNLVKPVDAGNLFNQIRLQRKVEPPGRDLEQSLRIILFDHLQTETGEDSQHFLRLDIHADHAADAVEGKRDASRGLVTVVDIDHALGGRPAAEADEEGNGASARPVGEIRVDASDVAVGSLRRETELSRRELGGDGFEQGALDQDVFGAGCNLAPLAPHDPGDGGGSLCVGDNQHGGVELPVDSVKRADCLALGGPAHDDGTVGKRPIVKGVERVAALQHHIVCDIDNQRNRAHPAHLQTVRHPVGRLPVLHACQDARRVAGAEIRRVHPDLRERVDRIAGFGERDIRQFDRTPE